MPKTKTRKNHKKSAAKTQKTSKPTTKSYQKELTFLESFEKQFPEASDRKAKNGNVTMRLMFFSKIKPEQLPPEETGRAIQAFQQLITDLDQTSVIPDRDQTELLHQLYDLSIQSSPAAITDEDRFEHDLVATLRKVTASTSVKLKRKYQERWLSDKIIEKPLAEKEALQLYITDFLPAASAHLWIMITRPADGTTQTTKILPGKKPLDEKAKKTMQAKELTLLIALADQINYFTFIKSLLDYTKSHDLPTFLKCALRSLLGIKINYKDLFSHLFELTEDILENTHIISQKYTGTSKSHILDRLCIRSIQVAISLLNETATTEESEFKLKKLSCSLRQKNALAVILVGEGNESISEQLFDKLTKKNLNDIIWHINQIDIYQAATPASIKRPFQKHPALLEKLRTTAGTSYSTAPELADIGDLVNELTEVAGVSSIKALRDLIDQCVEGSELDTAITACLNTINIMTPKTQLDEYADLLTKAFDYSTNKDNRFNLEWLKSKIDAANSAREGFISADERKPVMTKCDVYMKSATLERLNLSAQPTFIESAPTRTTAEDTYIHETIGNCKKEDLPDLRWNSLPAPYSFFVIYLKTKYLSISPFTHSQADPLTIDETIDTTHTTYCQVGLTLAQLITKKVILGLSNKLDDDDIYWEEIERKNKGEDLAQMAADLIFYNIDFANTILAKYILNDSGHETLFKTADIFKPTISRALEDLGQLLNLDSQSIQTTPSQAVELFNTLILVYNSKALEKCLNQEVPPEIFDLSMKFDDLNDFLDFFINAFTSHQKLGTSHSPDRMYAVLSAFSQSTKFNTRISEAYQCILDAARKKEALTESEELAFAVLTHVLGACLRHPELNLLRDIRVKLDDTIIRKWRNIYEQFPGTTEGNRNRRRHFKNHLHLLSALLKHKKSTRISSIDGLSESVRSILDECTTLTVKTRSSSSRFRTQDIDKLEAADLDKRIAAHLTRYFIEDFQKLSSLSPEQKEALDLVRTPIYLQPAGIQVSGQSSIESAAQSVLNYARLLYLLSIRTEQAHEQLIRTLIDVLANIVSDLKPDANHLLFMCLLNCTRIVSITEAGEEIASIQEETHCLIISIIKKLGDDSPRLVNFIFNHLPLLPLLDSKHKFNLFFMINKHRRHYSPALINKLEGLGIAHCKPAGAASPAIYGPYFYMYNASSHQFDPINPNHWLQRTLVEFCAYLQASFIDIYLKGVMAHAPETPSGDIDLLVECELYYDSKYIEDMLKASVKSCELIINSHTSARTHDSNRRKGFSAQLTGDDGGQFSIDISLTTPGKLFPRSYQSTSHTSSLRLLRADNNGLTLSIPIFPKKHASLFFSPLSEKGPLTYTHPAICLYEAYGWSMRLHPMKFFRNIVFLLKTSIKLGLPIHAFNALMHIGLDHLLVSESPSKLLDRAARFFRPIHYRHAIIADTLLNQINHLFNRQATAIEHSDTYRQITFCVIMLRTMHQSRMKSEARIKSAQAWSIESISLMKKGYTQTNPAWLRKALPPRDAFLTHISNEGQNEPSPSS